MINYHNAWANHLFFHQLYTLHNIIIIISMVFLWKLCTICPAPYVFFCFFNTYLIPFYGHEKYIFSVFILVHPLISKIHYSPICSVLPKTTDLYTHNNNFVRNMIIIISMFSCGNSCTICPAPYSRNRFFYFFNIYPYSSMATKIYLQCFYPSAPLNF